MQNFKKKPNELMNSKKFMMIMSFLGLYLLSTGTSWAIFSYLIDDPGLGIGEQRMRYDPSLPKTEECILSGEMFTEPEREIWEKYRPLAIVIENHIDSRPQSGLSKADVVYEAVAEGGITRFLTFFYCRAAAEDVRVGPIRSARIYLVNWATEYGKAPLFVHVGGANNICKECPGGVKYRGQVAKEVRALEELIDLGWRAPLGNALDAGANVGYPVVWRDPERIPGVAYEHTFMGSTDKLFALGVDRGFGYENGGGDVWNEGFTEWLFSDDQPLSSPKAEEISFEFWEEAMFSKEYAVTWKYDLESNQYLRFHGEDKHFDMDNDEQLAAKNVVVQFVKETGPVDKEGHMFYTTIGEGDILLFQNGDVIEGTWEKKSQTSRTKFFDEDGKEVKFVRGPIWIEAVPTLNEISY